MTGIPIVPQSAAVRAGLYDDFPVVVIGDVLDDFPHKMFNGEWRNVAYVANVSCDRFETAWERLKIKYWLDKMHGFSEGANFVCHGMRDGVCR